VQSLRHIASSEFATPLSQNSAGGGNAGPAQVIVM
jgi:hypothetical protein